MEQHDKALTDSWDMVIGPPKGWFELHLRDLWLYRYLVALCGRRDFVSGRLVSNIGEEYPGGGAL